MSEKKSFTQKNGLVITEGSVYKSIMGELCQITHIKEEKNELKINNISDSCTSFHRIDRAITDNKFKSFIR